MKKREEEEKKGGDGVRITYTVYARSYMPILTITPFFLPSFLHSFLPSYGTHAFLDRRPGADPYSNYKWDLDSVGDIFAYQQYTDYPVEASDSSPLRLPKLDDTARHRMCAPWSARRWPSSIGSVRFFSSLSYFSMLMWFFIYIFFLQLAGNIVATIRVQREHDWRCFHCALCRGTFVAIRAGRCMLGRIRQC